MRLLWLGYWPCSMADSLFTFKSFIMYGKFCESETKIFPRPQMGFSFLFSFFLPSLNLSFFFLPSLLLYSFFFFFILLFIFLPLSLPSSLPFCFPSFHTRCIPIMAPSGVKEFRNGSLGLRQQKEAPWHSSDFPSCPLSYLAGKMLSRKKESTSYQDKREVKEEEERK